MAAKLKITKPAERKYYSISEVADKLKIKAYVLRFWEKEFPMLRPKKNRAGVRAYQDKDVVVAMRIRELLYQEGYTIEGARQQLRRKSDSTDEAPEQVRASAKPVKKELMALRKEVKEILALLEQA